jgi:hypothetical protein
MKVDDTEIGREQVLGLFDRQPCSTMGVRQVRRRKRHMDAEHTRVCKALKNSLGSRHVRNDGDDDSTGFCKPGYRLHTRCSVIEVLDDSQRHDGVECFKRFGRWGEEVAMEHVPVDGRASQYLSLESASILRIIEPRDRHWVPPCEIGKPFRAGATDLEQARPWREAAQGAIEECREDPVHAVAKMGIRMVDGRWHCDARPDAIPVALASPIAQAFRRPSLTAYLPVARADGRSVTKPRSP